MGACSSVAALAFLREAVLFSHRTLREMLQRLLNCLTAPRAGLPALPSAVHLFIGSF